MTANPSHETALHTAIRHATTALWRDAGLPGDPAAAPAQLHLTGDGADYASSFGVDVAGAAAVAATTLASALVYPLRGAGGMPAATIDVAHALAETTGYFTVDGHLPDIWAPISGLYACGAAVGQPGWVRIHANFEHHRDGVLQLLGLPLGPSATQQQVAHALQAQTATDFEAKAAAHGLVVAAARTPEEWAAHPQSAAIAAQPLVQISALDAERPAPPRPWPKPLDGRPLHGLRVLDLTRILAGPVAARTLAAQGAEVLMINGPGRPNIDAIADTSRGKRSALLDLQAPDGKARFGALVQDAHVLLQGYRPGALDALGWSPAQAALRRPGIVYASLSAYGRSGPWADRRGFDSLVQTASGINTAEAQAFGETGQRVLPMQILDYCAGFLLAFGIQAALVRQATQGGSWHVQVSLARVAQWLVSLGRRRVSSGTPPGERVARLAPYLESQASGFGDLTAVRHSGILRGVSSAWLYPSVRPGTDAPAWPPLPPM